MNFCQKCNNYMKIKEMDIDNKRDIYYICKSCDFSIKSSKSLIFKKSYKRNIKKDWIKNPEFAVNDNTLPRKSTKCPSCKKINENVYYQNKDLTISLICHNCKNIWIYS